MVEFRHISVPITSPVDDGIFPVGNVEFTSINVGADTFCIRVLDVNSNPLQNVTVILEAGQFNAQETYFVTTDANGEVYVPYTNVKLGFEAPNGLFRRHVDFIGNPDACVEITLLYKLGEIIRDDTGTWVRADGTLEAEYSDPPTVITGWDENGYIASQEGIATLQSGVTITGDLGNIGDQYYADITNGYTTIEQGNNVYRIIDKDGNGNSIIQIASPIGIYSEGSLKQYNWKKGAIFQSEIDGFNNLSVRENAGFTEATYQDGKITRTNVVGSSNTNNINLYVIPEEPTYPNDGSKIRIKGKAYFSGRTGGSSIFWLTRKSTTYSTQLNNEGIYEIDILDANSTDLGVQTGLNDVSGNNIGAFLQILSLEVVHESENPVILDESYGEMQGWSELRGTTKEAYDGSVRDFYTSEQFNGGRRIYTGNEFGADTSYDYFDYTQNAGVPPLELNVPWSVYYKAINQKRTFNARISGWRQGGRGFGANGSISLWWQQSLMAVLIRATDGKRLWVEFDFSAVANDANWTFEGAELDVMLTYDGSYAPNGLKLYFNGVDVPLQNIVFDELIGTETVVGLTDEFSFVAEQDTTHDVEKLQIINRVTSFSEYLLVKEKGTLRAIEVASNFKLDILFDREGNTSPSTTSDTPYYEVLSIDTPQYREIKSNYPRIEQGLRLTDSRIAGVDQWIDLDKTVSPTGDFTVFLNVHHLSNDVNLMDFFRIQGSSGDLIFLYRIADPSGILRTSLTSQTDPDDLWDIDLKETQSRFTWAITRKNGKYKLYVNGTINREFEINQDLSGLINFRLASNNNNPANQIYYSFGYWTKALDQLDIIHLHNNNQVNNPWINLPSNYNKAMQENCVIWHQFQDGSFYNDAGTLKVKNWADDTGVTDGVVNGFLGGNAKRLSLGGAIGGDRIGTSNYPMDLAQAKSYLFSFYKDTFTGGLQYLFFANAGGGRSSYGLIDTAGRVNYSIAINAGQSTNRIIARTVNTDVIQAGNKYVVIITDDGTGDINGMQIFVNGVNQAIERFSSASTISPLYADTFSLEVSEDGNILNGVMHHYESISGVATAQEVADASADLNNGTFTEAGITYDSGRFLIAWDFNKIDTVTPTTVQGTPQYIATDTSPTNIYFDYSAYPTEQKISYVGDQIYGQ